MMSLSLPVGDNTEVTLTARPGVQGLDIEVSKNGLVTHRHRIPARQVNTVGQFLVMWHMALIAQKENVND